MAEARKRYLFVRLSVGICCCLRQCAEDERLPIDSLLPLSSDSGSSSSSSCSSPELSPQLDVPSGKLGNPPCPCCTDSVQCDKCWTGISLAASGNTAQTAPAPASYLQGIAQLRRKLHQLCHRILSLRLSTRVVYAVLLAAGLLLLVLSVVTSERAIAGVSWMNSAMLDECSWKIPEFEQLASFAARKATTPPSESSLKQVEGLTELWATLETSADANRPRPLTGIPRPSNRDGVRDISAEMLDSLIDFDETDAMASRAAFMNFTQHIPAYPKDLFTGRGVIMIAGGKYSGFAATALGSLRLTGSVLPVEMWMPHRSDDLQHWCDELPSDGARCRFFTDYMPTSLFYGPSLQFSHGYQYKALAMLLSTFEEVLLLDADNHALAKVDGVFDAPTYRDHRSILWPDYWTYTANPWLSYVVGLSEQKKSMLVGQPTVESGQLLWDKRQRWRVSLSSLRMGAVVHWPRNFADPTTFRVW